MSNPVPAQNRVLSMIILSQFACASIWFAGNAVIDDLCREAGLDAGAVGYLTSMVQFGFITGTLTFAILSIADRFSPSKVFLFSAMAGAVSNIAMLYVSESVAALLGARFLTGFFLAGIYPVGMKIAADYFEHGIGKALGYLVGALVLGTAFPHLLKGVFMDFSWKYVIISTTVACVLGGLLIGLFVPDGPYRKKGTGFRPAAIIKVFHVPEFRGAAFGYFGHMWELYAFWAFVPSMLRYRAGGADLSPAMISILSFAVIAAGALSCAIGGHISVRHGSAKVAFFALAASGAFCLVSPLMYHLPVIIYFLLLILWGMAVTADSPQFSSLVAQSAVPELRGSALTIVNCIGFAITIVSIQLLNGLFSAASAPYLFLVLAPGPLLGLLAIGPYAFRSKRNK